MSVALTGSHGYVGSIIAEGISSDVELIRLGRRPSSHRNDITWTLEGPNDDLARKLSLLGVSDLIHAAWDMTTSSAHDAEHICVQGTLNLLEAAKAAGISRVIFISTISAFDEARSVYGQTKRIVEKIVLAEGGVVLRLGIVHGSSENVAEGGMYGALRRAVRKSRFVPIIGAGNGPQYRLEARRLQKAIQKSLNGSLDDVGRPITLADDTPISLRSLIHEIGTEEGRCPVPVPVPWRLLHIGLRTLEMFGAEPAVRSDSVISFINSNPSPDFSEARRLEL